MAEGAGLSRGKRVAFTAVIALIGVGLALVLAEAVARWLEPDRVIHGYTRYPRHDVLGWTPPLGEATVTTHEFVAHYDVNELAMNDRPVEESRDRVRLRALALGDSHTFAVGVSQEEAWPNVLEAILVGDDPDAAAVYNGGVVGYSLGQYLLRMRALEDALDPQLVLVGFSMATDLYDIIPPRLGGFIYGHPWGRVYFDLDESGALVEHHELVGKDVPETGGRSRTEYWTRWLTSLPHRLALFRRIKRSQLAMALSVRLSSDDMPLWPGLDVALKRELGERDRYLWSLAGQLVAKIAAEADARDRRVVLVAIPYLAQAYDEVWEASFGSQPEKYDRFVGGRRLKEICERSGVEFVDTTEAFIAQGRSQKDWLHFRDDGHPTAAGHRLIAEVVARFLRERGLDRAPGSSGRAAAGADAG